jgi:prepilin-type N-terminal cleavage/methylation domain-containing protein
VISFTLKRTGAFTLIELLVVISIIALLIGILLPALANAKKASRVAACGQTIRQIGIAIHAYAADGDGQMPINPLPVAPPHWFGDEAATNMVYSTAHTPTDYVGLGVILENYLEDPRTLFCPGDDSSDPAEELSHIESQDENAFGSYLYRQLDQTSNNRLEDLGFHPDTEIAATALAFDMNSLIPGDAFRTNHGNETVNILYTDSHVLTVANATDMNDGLFTLRPADMSDFFARMDEMLLRADYGAIGEPANAPMP